MNDIYNATLVKRTNITDNLVIYGVKPDTEIPDFIPGQYVALGLMPEESRPVDSPSENEEPKPGRLIKRTYSIGSSPLEKDYYEFYLAIVPEGALTSRLCLLQEGDRLYCAPKVVGKFTLEVIPDNAEVTMVATGTGIAPFISMLRTEETWKDDRKIKVVYGVRYPEDFAYQAELENIAQQRENFSYHLTVSRDSDCWQGSKGYVQDFFSKGEVALDPNNSHVMLCGNPAMIDDMQSLLEKNGLKVHSRKEPGNIHLEKYW